ncbi:hypothetical protein GGR53DRAFT_6696 [Hypoxylon sp. FL1150]|nr:hypothetical protein GGR53DRAFT_6696 [Hypoxylon sp. FL1150]
MRRSARDPFLRRKKKRKNHTWSLDRSLRNPMRRNLYIPGCYLGGRLPASRPSHGRGIAGCSPYRLANRLVVASSREGWIGQMQSLFAGSGTRGWQAAGRTCDIDTSASFSMLQRIITASLPMSTSPKIALSPSSGASETNVAMLIRVVRLPRRKSRQFMSRRSSHSSLASCKVKLLAGESDSSSGPSWSAKRVACVGTTMRTTVWEGDVTMQAESLCGVIERECVREVPCPWATT